MGFSLVELLVVVALVTVLVGVLAPIAVQSRNRARAAACMSNLRQLGSAVSDYSQDWTDRLPRLGGSPFAGSVSSTEWADGSTASEFRAAVSRYVRNNGVYLCANDTGAPEFGYHTGHGSVFSRCGSSYLPWSSARAGRYGVAMNGSRPSSKGPTSGQCILRDYGSNWHGYRTRSGLDLEVTTVANGAFADGHVSSIPVFSAAISGRRYSCYASTRTSAIFIAGGSGDVRVEVSGSFVRPTEATDQSPLKLSLSGTAEGGGVSYNVDRVFSFAHDTQLDAAFKQVAVWADSLVAR